MHVHAVDARDMKFKELSVGLRYDFIKAQILVMLQKKFYSMTQWPSSSVNGRRLESKGLFMAKPQWPHDQLK